LPGGFDQPVLDQRPQHAVQRLLGDAEDAQQVVHRGARAAVDEVDRPVMRAAIALLGEDPVGVGGETAIGEEHRLDPLPQLLVGQVEQLSPRPGRLIRCIAACPASGHSRGHQFMSALLTFQDPTGTESQAFAQLYVRSGPSLRNICKTGGSAWAWRDMTTATAGSGWTASSCRGARRMCTS
jgi:hypothetical protein